MALPTERSIWPDIIIKVKAELAMITGTWDTGESERALRQAGVPERTYARFPVVLEKGIIDRSQVYAESYSWGLSISVNNPNPEKTMEFFDFLAGDDGTLLLNWGVEGQHYNVEDGKRVMKAEVLWLPIFSGARQCQTNSV